MTRALLLAPLLAPLLLAACDGAVGTIALDLTTAPGSTVLDAVQLLRLTVTSPRAVFETERTSGGLDLSIELDVGGEAASLIVEGFDASGGLVATGMSPEFPFGPTDARIVIYVAPPMSIARAPTTLSAARSDVATAPLSYGALFAGGRDGAGLPTDAVAVYNAFDHSLVGGLALPAPRTDLVLAPIVNNNVYVYGGVGGDGSPTGSLLRFDTTTRPNGSYADLGDQAGFARSKQAAVRIGPDRFLITGAPPVELLGGVMTARTELAELPALGAALADGTAAMFVGGATGLVLFRADGFDTLAGDATRERAAITALPDATFLVIGGGDATTPTRDALVVDPVTGVVTRRVNALATGRYAPAVAATARHIVISGGVDAAGAAIATAEILDAASLERLATLPVAPRAGAQALPLPNGQVVIVGGSLATDIIELFTPPPPE